MVDRVQLCDARFGRRFIFAYGRNSGEELLRLFERSVDLKASHFLSLHVASKGRAQDGEQFNRFRNGFSVAT
jgi:hypothetical protein